MSNCILENHPVKTLISVFALGIATSWAICHFTINESEQQSHNAEIKNKDAQIETLKSLCNQYEARIDVMDSEIQSLRNTNDLYWDCISKDTGLSVYIKGQIEKMLSIEKNLKSVPIKDVVSQSDSITIDTGIPATHAVEIRIKEKDSYIDYEPTLVIGIHTISISEEAIVNISVDGEIIANQQRVTAGDIFTYYYDQEMYQITIKTINYVYGFIKVVITN